MSAIVSVKNLSFSYESKTKKKAVSVENNILEIPEFSINAGEHVFLFGPSGSGKSTLLNILTGLLLPTSGQVKILEQDWSSLQGKARDAFRANHIGFVFQQLNLIPYLDVLDNILLGAEFGQQNRPKHQLIEQAKQLMSDLQLPESLLLKPASQLSVGQQQRVAIARALIKEPELLIADEPTSALDEANRNAFLKVLFELAEKNNTTLVFVSHDQTLASQFKRVVGIQSINKASKSGE